MSLLNVELENTTVAIGVKRDKNKFNWIGTGFLVFKKMNDNNEGFLFLVTNKHVIENKNDVVIRLVLKDGTVSNEIIKVQDDKKKLYYQHSNEKIDIAVFILNGNKIVKNFDKIRCFNIDTNSYTSEEYIDNGGFEGSDVFMLGFPLGLIEEYSITPICRKGCIARMNNFDICNNYSFILDIQNFPGNSGSPIISCPDSVSIGKTKKITKCALIGIVHSYIPYRENLINVQTNEVVEVRTENSGLALAHPIEFLEEIIATIVDSYHAKEIAK